MFSRRTQTLLKTHMLLDEGNKLHLELDNFGDDDRDDENDAKRVVVLNNDSDANMDIFKSASPSKVKNSAAVNSNAESYLTSLSRFNRPFAQFEILWSIHGYHYLQIISLETYESHVIPMVNS
ncbi:hypothetical protein ALC53_13590 [Atta colombica]|uniref:Uncharacterized protein n=1 Tax=Atta colombica TaxID=520822 RepID=A0A195AVQ3_9HYME|nr:hypothetical protein ALC53_13590 [Atta colombica]